MFVKLIKSLIGMLPTASVVAIIKEQIEKNAPKLTDEQKTAILNVATELAKAAAAGAVQGAVSK